MKLMAEREKYEQWLRELDEKRDSTPEKVFVRVKEDYSTRLQEVVDALREHTSAMQEHARNLMVRLKELEVSEEELLEEQSENELRAKVGELSQSEFETSKKKAQRLLVKFKEDQEMVADDLTRIRDLLSGDADQNATADEPPRHSTDFDELEFLKSVVGPTTPVAPPAPRVSAAKPAVSQAEPTSAAPTPAPPPAAPPAPPAPAKAAEAPKPEAPKPEAPVAKAGTPASTLRVTSETPNALHSQQSGQPKTLKCAECGAMNYPSEWYCERCGAELTLV